MPLELSSLLSHVTSFLPLFLAQALRRRAQSHRDASHIIQPRPPELEQDTELEAHVNTNNDLFAWICPLCLDLYGRLWEGERSGCSRILFPGQMRCHLTLILLMMKLRHREVSLLPKDTSEIRSWSLCPSTASTAFHCRLVCAPRSQSLTSHQVRNKAMPSCSLNQRLPILCDCHSMVTWMGQFFLP